MRISHLSIDGFGVWSGLELADLSEQLTVIYGPNEAGKSTLLQFIRSILYGFSDERRLRYLPPVHGGRPGGSLRLAGDEERIVLARYADDGSAAGRLVASDARGETVPSAPALAALLGDLDEATFNGAFAVGLKELQEFGALGETEAAHWLFELSLGLDGISLGEVLRELSLSRNRLLSADDRPSVVGQLLSQERRLDQELNDLADRTPRYVELVQEAEQIDRELHAAEVRLREARGRLQTLERAAALLPQWRRRAELDEKLASVAHLVDLPGELLEKLIQVRRERAASRQQLRQWNAAVKKAKAAAKACGVNAGLVRHAPRIEALAEQQPWLEALSAQMKEAASAVEEIELARLADREQLGAAVAGAPAGAKPVPAATLQTIKSLARARRAARQNLHALQAESNQARQAALEAQQQLQATLGKRAGGSLAEALEQAGERVSHFRRRVQLDSRLEMWQLQHAELEQRVQTGAAGQLVPDHMVIVWGAAFALAFALLLAGLLLPASATGGWGWPLFFLGALSIGAVVGTRRALAVAGRRRLVEARGQMRSLEGQMRQALADRDALDRLLPAGGGPLAVRLQNAERELASLEALAPAAALGESGKRQADALEESIRKAQSETAGLRKRWRTTLEQAGLPADFKPGQWKLLAATSGKLAAHDRAQAEREGELARRVRECEMLAGRIRALCGELGIALPSQNPLEQLQHLRSALAENQQRERQRRSIVHRLRRMLRKRTKLRRRLARLARQRELLLKAAAVTSLGQLRRRSEALAQRAAWRDERAAVEGALAASLGQADAQVHALLTAGVEPAGEREQWSQRAATSEASLAKLHERRGQVRTQSAALAQDHCFASKSLERGLLEGRIEEAMARWRSLAVAGHVLAEVRDYFQTQRQPETLQEASRWLARFTVGKYTRVWTSLDVRELFVDDASGKTLSVEALSRGTREQLFLSLRLALASTIAAEGTQVPLILDDILVNFDTARTKAAAGVLRDFAKAGHQVLLFTCHEHVAKLFKSLRVDVRQLSGPPPVVDEAEPAEEVVESRPRRRTRERVDAATISEAPPPDPSFPNELPPERIRPDAPAPPVPRPHVEFKATEVPRPAAAAPIPPPPAVPAAPSPAAPAPRARVVRTSTPGDRAVRQQRWNAEEFDGELADRVYAPAVQSAADPDQEAA